MIDTATAIADITQGIDRDATLWDRPWPWTISRGQIWARVDNYCDDPALDPDDFEVIRRGVMTFAHDKGVLRND